MNNYSNAIFNSTLNARLVNLKAGSSTTFAAPNISATSGVIFEDSSVELIIDCSNGDMNVNTNIFLPELGGGRVVITGGNKTSFNESLGSNISRLSIIEVTDCSAFFSKDIHADELSFVNNSKTECADPVHTNILNITSGEHNFYSSVEFSTMNIIDAVINFHAQMDPTKYTVNITGNGVVNYLYNASICLTHQVDSVILNDSGIQDRKIVNKSLDTNPFGSIYVTADNIEFTDTIGDANAYVENLFIGDDNNESYVTIHANTYVTNVQFNNEVATLELGEENIATSIANITSLGNGYGIIDSSYYDNTISCNIGSLEKPIEQLIVGKNFTYSGNEAYINIIRFVDNISTFIINSSSNISASFVSLDGGIINAEGAYTKISENIGSTNGHISKIKIANDATFEAKNNLYSDDIYYGNENSTLLISGENNGQRIFIGNATSGSAGILKLSGSGTRQIDGYFGSSLVRAGKVVVSGSADNIFVSNNISYFSSIEFDDESDTSLAFSNIVDLAAEDNGLNFGSSASSLYMVATAETNINYPISCTGTAGILSITGTSKISFNKSIASSETNRLILLNLAGIETVFASSVFVKHLSITDSTLSTFQSIVSVESLNLSASNVALLESFSGNINISSGNCSILIADGKQVTGNIDNLTGTNYSGKVTLNGAAIITGTIGETKPLELLSIIPTTGIKAIIQSEVKSKSIEIGSGIVEFEDDVTSNIKFIASESFVILDANNNITGNVDNISNTDGVGTLQLQSGTSVYGNLGETNSLSSIIISHGNYSFTGTIHSNNFVLSDSTSSAIFSSAVNIANATSFSSSSQSLVFNSSANINVDFAGNDATVIINAPDSMSGFSAINSGVSGRGLVIISANQTLGGNIGSNNISEVRIEGSHKLDTAGKNIKASSITNPGSGGQLNIDTPYTGTIGTSSDKFSLVESSANLHLSNLYATNYKSTNSDLEITENMVSDVTLSGSATVKIKSGASFDGKIDGDGGSNTSFIFEDGYTFIKEVGSSKSLGNLSLAENKNYVIQTATVNADIVAGNGSSIEVNNPDTSAKSLTINNTTIELGANTLNLSSGGTWNGNNILNISINDAQDHGMIKVTGGILDISTQNSLTININYPVNKNITSVKLFSASGGTIHEFDGAVTVNNNSSVTKWKYNSTTMSLVPKVNIHQLLQESYGDTALFHSNNSGNALTLAEVISAITDDSERAQAIESLKPVSHSIQVTNVVSDIIHETIGTRIDNVSSQFDSFGSGTSSTPYDVNKTKHSAEAAGDNDINQKFGFWSAQFGGLVKQKENSNNIPAFKSKSYGTTVGFDIEKDRLILGVSGTYCRSTIENTGDKGYTNSPSWKLSLYGAYNIYHGLFTKFSAGYGESQVNTMSYKQLPNLLQNTRTISKYKSKNISAEASIGYRFRASPTIFITPTFGIMYDHAKDTSYMEKGGGITDRYIKAKKYYKMSWLFNLSASAHFYSNHLVFTPEIHANIARSFSYKDPIVRSTLQGSIEEYSQKLSTQKSTYGAGCSIDVGSKKKESITFGIGMDIKVAKKYIARQGFIKLRIAL
ncbi:MAG: autotransporter domain-containing protein [Rickettsiaceae bacterium]|nr:autotransporter domain-containing protein [Rickettsiaceae bacterium]